MKKREIIVCRRFFTILFYIAIFFSIPNQIEGLCLSQIDGCLQDSSIVNANSIVGMKLFFINENTRFRTAPDEGYIIASSHDTITTNLQKEIAEIAGNLNVLNRVKSGFENNDIRTVIELTCLNQEKVVIGITKRYLFGKYYVHVNGKYLKGSEKLRANILAIKKRTIKIKNVSE